MSQQYATPALCAAALLLLQLHCVLLLQITAGPLLHAQDCWPCCLALIPPHLLLLLCCCCCLLCCCQLLLLLLLHQSGLSQLLKGDGGNLRLSDRTEGGGNRMRLRQRDGACVSYICFTASNTS